LKNPQLSDFWGDTQDIALVQDNLRVAVQQVTDLQGQLQGQVQQFQASEADAASAAQIRNRIFQLLGGGQLTFEDAYQYAKLASGATGIDPAFILAILDRESALGQNVGQCNYKSAMRPSDIPVFL